MYKTYEEYAGVRLIAFTQPSNSFLDDIQNKQELTQDSSAQDLIAYCAKVSNPGNQSNTLTNERLISYLIKHQHWSPLEMVDVVLEIDTTRDIGRQIIRHKSFTPQEFCVSGNTEIYFDLPNGLKKGKRALYKKQIKDLFKIWTSSSWSKDRIKNMNVRIYDETAKTISNSHIKDIFYTGKKPVFKLTLEDGKSITSTKEHKFLSAEGFDTLENLVGLNLIANTATMSRQCEIAINGIPCYQDKEWLELAKKRSIENKTGVSGIAEEAGVSYHTIRKWLKRNDISFSKKEVAQYTTIWNKGKFGYKLPPKSEETREKHRSSAKKGSEFNLWRGGVDRGFRREVLDYISKYRDMLLKKANYKCSKCESNSNLQLHHIIPVYADASKAFDLDNIQVLCKDCRIDVHRGTNMPRGKPAVLSKGFSKVVSIEYIGVEDTYDLEIDHESHNYVANGIITHNSQRYEDVTKSFDGRGMQFVLRAARRQDDKNRQNSIDDIPEDIKKQWLTKQTQIIHEAQLAYKWAIEQGIAKECARVVLPEGNTATRLYFKGSIRSWIHYVALRSGNGTQLEHIMIARACAEAIAKIFPMINNFVERE